MSDAFSPDRTEASSDLDAHARILEEIAHVARLVAVFGDDPERVAYQSVPDRRSPGLTGPAAGGFDEGIAEGQDPEGQQCSDGGVDEVSLHRTDDPPF
jgi:hypothetical protein